MAEQLLALAERVDSLEGPDRDLDAEIHKALFGSQIAHPVGLVWNDPFDPLKGHSAPFRFTGHLEAAEYALPGPEWPEYQITRRYCTGYHASIGTGQDGRGCETAAIALLSASLRARASALKEPPQ